MAITTKEEWVIMATSLGVGWSREEYQFVLNIWEGKVEGVGGKELVAF